EQNDFDLVVNATMPAFVRPILKACSRVGVDYLDMASNEILASSTGETVQEEFLVEQFEFDAAYRETGHRALILAGGDAALSPVVEQAVTDAGFVADRRGGDDRWATAAALRAAAGERGGGGLDPLVLASGTAFPDALGAGVLAARLGGGLLLVDPTDLDASPASAAALDGAAPDRVLVAGGPAGISDRVLDQVRAALAG
ncbi:MAG: cell wall-binding repeat-containing protein, partial [Actinomycetota bacterium]